MINFVLFYLLCQDFFDTLAICFIYSERVILNLKHKCNLVQNTYESFKEESNESLYFIHAKFS